LCQEAYEIADKVPKQAACLKFIGPEPTIRVTTYYDDSMCIVLRSDHVRTVNIVNSGSLQMVVDKPRCFSMAQISNHHTLPCNWKEETENTRWATYRMADT